MAVKEAGADCVMTSYGSVNGTWTAGSYDLNTVILREEWGFKGMVMTDWWAEINDEEHPEPVRTNFAAMLRAEWVTFKIYFIPLSEAAGRSDRPGRIYEVLIRKLWNYDMEFERGKKDE